jgi:hypothetical protein
MLRTYEEPLLRTPVGSRAGFQPPARAACGLAAARSASAAWRDAAAACHGMCAGDGHRTGAVRCTPMRRNNEAYAGTTGRFDCTMQQP